MKSTPVLKGTSNNPGPVAWTLIILGIVMLPLGPVFYAIKPDPVQLTMPLTLGLIAFAIGFIKMRSWTRVEIFDDRFRLSKRVGGKLIAEIPFSEITEMEVQKGSEMPGDNRVTITTGGKKHSMTRVKPVELAGQMWVAAMFHSLLPVAAMEGMPRRARFKDFPAGLKVASRLIKHPDREYQDQGVLIPCNGRMVYVPVTDATKGPGALAIMVSPLLVTRTLTRGGTPNPSQMRSLALVCHVWQQHKISAAQKDAFFAAFAEEQLCSWVDDLSKVNEPGVVHSTADGMEVEITVQDGSMARVVFSSQGL